MPYIPAPEEDRLLAAAITAVIAMVSCVLPKETHLTSLLAVLWLLYGIPQPALLLFWLAARTLGIGDPQLILVPYSVLWYVISQTR